MPDEIEFELPPFLAAGMACTELIANPAGWINRRVETIELLSHEETRRRVSIDFTLTDEQLVDLDIAEGIAVPISVLTKEARRNFDLRDESGRAVSVLGRRQNGELALIAGLSGAVNALPDDLPHQVLEILAADFRQIIFAHDTAAEDALGVFVGSAEDGDRWRAAVWEDHTCRSLLLALWRNYVLFAVLPHGGPNRRILKYSYGDDFDLSVLLGRIPDRDRRAARRHKRPPARQPMRMSFLFTNSSAP